MKDLLMIPNAHSRQTHGLQMLKYIAELVLGACGLLPTVAQTCEVYTCDQAMREDTVAWSQATVAVFPWYYLSPRRSLEPFQAFAWRQSAKRGRQAKRDKSDRHSDTSLSH